MWSLNSKQMPCQIIEEGKRDMRFTEWRLCTDIYKLKCPTACPLQKFSLKSAVFNQTGQHLDL